MILKAVIFYVDGTLADTEEEHRQAFNVNLKEFDLPSGCFEVIRAGEGVVAKKPAPDVYQSVLACLRLTSEDCLAIEDSGNGVRAAIAADIPVLVTECT
ncbi:MAG TPA: HAD-IA family hydrolase [Rhodocyclaceae bacterium]|nr:HAD-IA family hydrolase [Rhodocyclaceae bacterium]